MNAVAARLVCFSAFPCKVCPPAVFACIVIFFIAAHIFSTQGKITKAVACANVPNFFIHIGIGFKVCNISINIAQCCFQSTDINSVVAVKQIGIINFYAVISFACCGRYFNFIAVGNFSHIQVGIKNVAAESYFVVTACNYIKSAYAAFYISAGKVNFIIAGFVAKILIVFEHTGVAPVLVNLAVYPQTGTQNAFVAVYVAVNVAVRITDFTGNFYVVSFLFKVCHAYAEAVEFISKFCCQFINISAFGHCFCYNLSHFVAGHKFVAAVSAVGVTVYNTFCSQFVNCVISPVACRYITERVCGISACGNAKSHCHC